MSSEKKINLGKEGKDDMVQVQDIDEPTMIKNLEIRFSVHKIYTYVGSILIALNPYKAYPIYTPSIMRMYDGVVMGQLPPHIFAVADAAYRSARTEGRDQSILISGESGAGKTETVKFILNHLTHISGKDKKVTKVKITPQERVISSNPVLEAFGNAKTIRNNNSSRFAKMCDIQFDKTGYIIGGRISQYLLEKSRVVRQAKGERNFHSFYYLLAGCDKTERAVWGLYDAKHYKYTNQTRVYEVPGINSKIEYVNLKRSMTIGGISVHNQHLIFTLLAAVLHLGNVRFDGGNEASIKNMEVVKWIAHLLKCDLMLLQQALLFREAVVADEVVSVPLSQQKALDTRDTLARELYGRNFQWITQKLNDDMEAKEFDRIISLLDIFGFEQYEVNGFEQFCINYANERMQHEFNEHIFKIEKEEYINDGLDVSEFRFNDNQPALDIIETPKSGIMALLDQETKSSTGTDSTFLVKVLMNPELNNTKDIMSNEPVFMVKHYAGEVIYDVTGFLETNRERFSSELVKALQSSKIEYFVELFSTNESKEERPSIISQFKRNLIHLMKTLGEGVPQYVRCFKPNLEQSHEIFDRDEVLRQLRNAGILDTVRIRKDGYPFRRSHETFVERYEMLLEEKELENLTTTKKIAQIFGHFSLNNIKHYQVGKQKVFVKDDVHHLLEGNRATYFNGAAFKIQNTMKGHLIKMKYLRKKAACKTIQFWMRKYIEAVDVSEELQDHLMSLEGENIDKLAKKTGLEMKKAERKIELKDARKSSSTLKRLSKIAEREVNADQIVKKGGVSTILTTIEDDDVDDESYEHGTSALSKMAKKKDHSTMIARSGGVVSMIKNINVMEEKKFQPHSINLLGSLSEEEKNLGIVIREGGLEALTNALTKTTNIDMVTDLQLSAAANALGKLSANKSVARVMGRDHNSIKAVIEGIRQKPKFARLTEYSINCIANMAQSRDNIESIIELGGIDVLLNAMDLHKGNDKVLKEIARTFQEIASNPLYAKMIGELGGLDLALEALKFDTAHCGPFALEIIQSLCSHPSNTTRLLKNGGLVLFLSILKADIKKEEVITTAMRMLCALSQDVILANQIISEDGAKIILDSLGNNPEFLEHNKHGIVCCVRLAQHDKDTFHVLKSMDVVSTVSQVMEKFSYEPSVIDIGKTALAYLADKQDLESAMDIVARSRMKNQTDKNLLETGLAIVVVGSLALIEDNVEYIVSEGGIPILLSVINGVSLHISDKIADKVLVPAIRAVARLLADEGYVDEFVSEAGVSSLVSAIQGQSDKERVCAVCTLAFEKLIASQTGYRELTKQGGLEAIISILSNHCEFERVTYSVVALLSHIAKTKAHGIRLLVERNCAESISVVLLAYQNNPDVLIVCIDLLRILSSSKRLEKKVLYECCEFVISGLKLSKDNSNLALSGLKILSKLSRDADGITFLKDRKASDIILTVLDEHYGNLDLTALATQILSNITGNKELIGALEILQDMSENLIRDPQNTEILTDMILPVTLIGSMASNVKAAGVIIENDGFPSLSMCLQSTKNCPSCPAQERLSKHIAVSISRLAGHKNFTKPLILSGVAEHLMTAVDAFIDYEEFVEETQNCLEVLSRNADASGYLIDSGVAKCVTSMVHAHPLNDPILISATRLLTRLAKNAEVSNLAIVRRDGVALTMTAVERFLTTEDHLIDSLTNLARLSTLSQDGTKISMGEDSMNLFIKVLSKHCNSPGVMTAACSTFAGLCEDKSFTNSFVSKGLLDRIVDGLEIFGENEEYCARAFAVLYKVALNKAHISALSHKSDMIIDIMIRHVKSQSVQSEGILVLTALASDEDLSKMLTNTGGIRTVFNGVRAHPLSPIVVTHGLAFAFQLAKVSSNHVALINERTKQMIQWAMKAYPQNAQLQAICRKCLTLLVSDEEELKRIQENGGQDASMPSIEHLEQEESEKQVKKIMGLLKIIKNPMTTKKHLAIALMGLANEKVSPSTMKSILKQGGLSRLVELMNQYSNDLSILIPVLKSLSRFSEKPEYVNSIVSAGGIGAILEVLKKNITHPDTLAVGMRLIGKLSSFNRLKVLIGLYGGLPIILGIMEKYLGIPTLVNKCVYCIGNLASNCMPNRKEILKAGGVNFVSFSMQKHRSFLELVINCARCLSPLCADDDESKVTVAKGGGSVVIIRAIMHHPDNPGLLQNGLNCLHKISRKMDIVPLLIHQGAIQAVVAAMKAYPTNVDLQLFGMEVLSNLSSTKAEDVSAQLTKGGTLDAVMKLSLEHKSHSRIQIAAYSCVRNLVINVEDEAAYVVQNRDFIVQVLNCISHPKALENLLMEGLELLTTLSHHEMNAKLVIASGAPEVNLLVLRRHADKREVCRKALLCLSKLSTNKEHARQLGTKGVVAAIIETLHDRGDDALFLTDVLRVMVNLAILEENGLTIAQTALEPLMKCVDNHFMNQNFLRMFYLLMSNVSMWPNASIQLINQGIIPAMIDTMKTSISYPSLLVRIVKVFTNFAAVGEEAKRMLSQDGALTAVQEVASHHKGHIQLKKAAELFLFKLSGVHNRQNMAEGADLSVHVERKLSEDLRNMLKGGHVFRRYYKGKVKKRLIRTVDFKHFVCLDLKKADEAVEKINIKFVKEIVPGACTEELVKKRFMSKQKKANPECCFALFDMRSNEEPWSLETDHPKEAAAWVQALQLLKEAHTEYMLGQQ